MVLSLRFVLEIDFSYVIDSLLFGHLSAFIVILSSSSSDSYLSSTYSLYPIDYSLYNTPRTTYRTYQFSNYNNASFSHLETHASITENASG